MAEGNGKTGKGSTQKDSGSAFLISDEVREIKIEHDGEAGIFKYRDIGAFDHHQILMSCGKYDPATGQMSLDLANYIHHFLKAALTEAPFELTDENIKRMRPAIATKLMNAIGAGIKIESAGRHSCA